MDGQSANGTDGEFCPLNSQKDAEGGKKDIGFFATEAQRDQRMEVAQGRELTAKYAKADVGFLTGGNGEIARA